MTVDVGFLYFSIPTPRGLPGMSVCGVSVGVLGERENKSLLEELMDRVARPAWGRGRGTGEIVQVERTLLQVDYRLAPGQTRTAWIDVLCLDGDGGRSWG